MLFRSPGGGSAPLSLQIQATDGSTGDYALEYVTVNYDTVAPPLVLDELGCFPKWGTEHGYVVNVTGHSEAGASIVIWSDYTAVTSAFAGEDGSFYIPLQFTVTGDSMPEFSVEAVDSAGNRSAAFAVTFPANPVTVNFDSNSENASCSVRSIEISSGSSIGVMPTPYYNCSAHSSHFGICRPRELRGALSPPGSV